MWENFGIGLFFLGSTAICTVVILGLSIFMERLYKRNNGNNK